MKNILNKTLILTMILTCIFSYTVFAQESYKIIEISYDYTNFDHIHVDKAFKVNITQGDEYSVVITASDYLKDKLDIHMDDSTLYIDLKDNIDVKKSKYEAHIVVPDLSSIEAVGASEVTGTLHLSDLTCIVNQASTIKLDGSASKLVVKADKSSKSYLKDFVAEEADVFAKNASTIEVTVNNVVKAEALLSSTIDVYGNPSFDKSAKDFTSKINGDSSSNTQNTESTYKPNNNSNTPVFDMSEFNFNFNKPVFNFPLEMDF